MDFEEITTTDIVGLGGVTISLSIITWEFIRWWFEAQGKSAGDKFKKNWRSLPLPFVPLNQFGMLSCYGMLLILSAGGILGSAASVALWGSNQVGRVALEQGVGGNDQNVTRTTNVVLNDGGHLVVWVCLVAFIAVCVFSRKKRGFTVRDVLVRMVLPVVCGVCLGLSDGMAGWAAQLLGPAVDSLGGFITQGF